MAKCRLIMMVRVIELAINNSWLLLLRLFSFHHNLIEKIIGTNDAMIMKIKTVGEIVPNKSRPKEKTGH